MPPTVVNASKLQRYEMINLSRQIQDVGVSLASGQSPFTVLVQQGTQIADIAASSGVSLGNMFKQAGAAVVSFLTPVRLAIGGVAGLAAGAVYFGNQWQETSGDVQRALIGIGARTGTTGSDIKWFCILNKGIFVFKIFFILATLIVAILEVINGNGPNQVIGARAMNIVFLVSVVFICLQFNMVVVQWYAFRFFIE